MTDFTKAIDEWVRMCSDNGDVGAAGIDFTRDGCEFRIVTLSDENTKVVRAVFVDAMQCIEMAKLTDRERLRERLDVLRMAALASIDFEVTTRRMPA